MPTDPSRLEDVWLRVRAVPPDDRPRALDEACGTDRALRQRVVELLDAARTADLERLFDDDPEVMLTAADVPLTFGRYDLRGLIGAGGMGEVYEGWDPTLGRPVAMKTLPARRGVGFRKTGSAGRWPHSPVWNTRTWSPCSTHNWTSSARFW